MPDKILVIAEKPSVAGDIARALGGMTRQGDYFEGEKYVVSSVIGHLLETVAPPEAEVKRGKWSLANLPVLPERFDLQPDKNNAPRLRVLEKLYARRDVVGVVNACDAGREGELIFYNLIRYFTEKKKRANGKPVRRLWLQSMTPAAIRGGFANLRDNKEFIPLQQAAVCRNEADWLVGINSTRAMTALNSVGGGFFKTAVGRVQTPTLGLLVEREEKIRAFTARPYWEVRANFAVAAGEYEGVWHAADAKGAAGAAKKTANKKDGAEKDKDVKPERIFDKTLAEKIVKECAAGKTGPATETVKPARELPPMLFDLTSLQRAANGRFGFSAKNTLALAQSLYQQHKLITYPRTDSRFLPEDYPKVVYGTLQSLANAGGDAAQHAKKVLAQKWVAGGNKRIFNNAKVSDHFAIVPTGEVKKGAPLREPERKLYNLIMLNFIAAFFPPAQFINTERKTRIGEAGEHCFVSKGRVMKDPGWRAVMSAKTEDVEMPPLTFARGQTYEDAKVADIGQEEKTTTPPARYNEATLLSAMETAGKLVDDEELREAMRERGLGTPATRAAIIEKLLLDGYVLRDRRDLHTTPKAHSLIRLLSALNVEALTQPALTGDWEHKLRRIETKNADHRLFMEDIRRMTKTIVAAAKNCGDVENIEGDFAELQNPCPACGGAVVEKYRRFACTKCEFFIWKAVAAREFSLEEAEALLKDGALEELHGFRSKQGREFSAKVVLQKTEEGQWRASFDFDNGESAVQSAADLADAEITGDCPKCGATVRELPARYLCEKAAGDNAVCDFSLGKKILQQEISPEQAKLLLTKGKTAFLDKFISKRTRRPFKAQLTMEPGSGKLGFEFAPRAGGAGKFAKKGAAKKGAAKKGAAKKGAAKKAAKK